jgi:hypothetical protein
MRQYRLVQTGVRVRGRLLAAYRGSRPGHRLFLGITVQLVWLICCCWAYTVVARTFDYEGFTITASVNPVRVFVVVAVLSGLALLLPRRFADPADYVVVALFDISFVPFCTYWTLSNQPWWQGILVTGYWALVLLISRVPIRLKAYYVEGAQTIAFLVARGLVLLGGILILAGGHLTLRLPLGDVYAVRDVWFAEGSWMSTYLFPWLANVILPFLLVHAWRNKRVGELLILGFTAYMLFTSTGMKAYLFMPALVAVILVVARWRPLSSLVPAGLGVFASTLIVLAKVTGSAEWISLGLRRAMFVPARLTSVYLEFFAVNPIVRLSDSILLRGWLQYPYPASVAKMIGTALGQPAMGANNGLVADGFANFGVVGVLVWAVLLGLLLNLFRATTESRENRPETWAVATMWPVVLLSSAFTTSLLTHGLLLGLLLAWSLAPGRDSQLLRQTNGQVPGSAGLADGVPSGGQGSWLPESQIER